jgi:hypothetical protein
LTGFERPDVVIDLSGEPSDVLESAPRRLRARAALAVGTVVLLAAIAVVQVANRPRPGPAGAAAPTETQQIAPQPTPSLDEDYDPHLPRQMLAAATFTGSDHGYATMLRCPTHRWRECTAEIMFTEDAGHGWSRVRSPSNARPVDGPPSELYVFDRDTLVLDQADWVPPPDRDATAEPLDPTGDPSVAPSTMPGYQRAGRWVSRNGGLSWHNVSPEPVGVVDAISEDERLIVAQRQSLAVVQVLRPDGSAARLAHQPLGKHVYPFNAIMASDGSVWLSGYVAGGPDQGSGDSAASRLYVSRDRGRTWRAVRLPKDTSAPIVSTADGRTLCSVDYRDDGAKIYTSHNSGTTWRELKLPVVNQAASHLNTSAAPLRDGGVLISHGGKVYRHDPRTGSREVRPDDPEVSWLVAAGAWVVGSSPDGAVWGLPPDGSAWIKLSGLT